MVYEAGPRDLVVQGAIAGLAIGVLQALVLRRSAWWALAMPPLSTLGWLVMWAAQVDVDRQLFTFGAGGAIAFTLLSGVLLVRLLRIPYAGDAVTLERTSGAHEGGHGAVPYPESCASRAAGRAA
ncbi:MAG: hypothetical protein QOF01_1454 [Thermomicrobiales bacterium]|nr:hypothetical protein [Thermomicrobiales bacterium]